MRLAGTALIICAFALVFGIPSGVTRTIDSEPPDALYDWLTAQAVVGEGHPSDNFAQLGSIHFPEGEFSPGPPSRPPSAVLLQLPYALVGPDVPLAFMSWLTIAAVIVLAVAVVHVLSFEWRWAPVLGCLILTVLPVRMAQWVGSQGVVVAALVAMTWIMSSRSDTPFAGVPLGVATGLKLFPGILIAMLWVQGRRATALGAAGVFVGLTCIGLTLPGMDLGSNVSALIDFRAHQLNNVHNLGLGLPLWATLIAISITIVLSRWSSINQLFVVGSAGMLLLSPIVWSHYYALTIVPLAYLARKHPWTIPVAGLLWLVPFAGEDLLVGIAGLLIAITVADISRAGMPRSINSAGSDPIHYGAGIHWPNR